MLPGANALTFGMLGCDFHCDYCQNWLTSQALRDPASDVALNLVKQIQPEQVVEIARKNHADVIVSSYNEPLITSEWAAGIFKEAQKAGLKCAFVSNGNATPEALDYLRPYLIAYKIDLKSMQEKNYRQLGGVLKNVLETIQKAHDIGLWVEIVTLIVPGFNDSNEELWDAARFLAGVSRDIPWHVTAFHKDYKMTEPDNTPARTLLRAAEIGREAGLNFVYAGNIPGRVEEYEIHQLPQVQPRADQAVGLCDPRVSHHGTGYLFALRGYHRRALAQRSQKSTHQWIGNADAGVLSSFWRITLDLLYNHKCTGCQPVREE